MDCQEFHCYISVPTALKEAFLKILAMLEIYLTYKLTVIDYLNRFSGKLPSEIAKVGLLSVFNASNIKFSGSIPDALYGLHNLDVLGLQVNLLSGNISSSIGSLKQLTELNLKGNDISGEIPMFSQPYV